jgi:hypothetical protein
LSTIALNQPAAYHFQGQGVTSPRGLMLIMVRLTAHLSLSDGWWICSLDKSAIDDAGLFRSKDNSVAPNRKL